MSFAPVIIINLILLIITILLAIADKLLVSYGECKITVHQEDEAKEFTVQGGSYLLTNLTENKIKITSSCAGKASCGYCKVWLKGGGPILPTEEISHPVESGYWLISSVASATIYIFVPSELKNNP